MKAFPCKEIHISEVNGDFAIEEHKGMDLRDYFAIGYVSGVVANPAFNIMTSFEELAKTGYNLADAMMEAREKK